MMCVEKAFDENRVLTRPKELSINKVGHGKFTDLYLIDLFYVSFCNISFLEYAENMARWRHVIGLERSTHR